MSEIAVVLAVIGQLVIAGVLLALYQQVAMRVTSLQERVDSLEKSRAAVDRLKREVSRVAPLHRVYRFSFGATESFLRQTGKAGDEDVNFVRKMKHLAPWAGYLIGTKLTIEDWRSHRVARTNGNETIYVYPPEHRSDGHTILWWAPIQESPTAFESTLEIRLTAYHSPDRTCELVVCGVYGSFGAFVAPDNVFPKEENVFLRVPLAVEKLEPFKLPDEPNAEEPWFGYVATPERTRYWQKDENLGLAWEMTVLDLEA